MSSLSSEVKEFVSKELKRYETTRSAIIPCLFKVQQGKGWVAPEDVEELSQLMDLPAAWINEVLYFYTMFNKKPVGRHHVQVCCNVSCSMAGGRELADQICQAFNIKDGEISADGKLSVSRVECLGSCGTAPMMQVNDKYYENLDAAKAVELIKGMK